jgi:hypothetical protein
MPAKSLRERFVHELFLFSTLLFCGFVLLPVLIFLVGDRVFGDFDGGYGNFFGQISRDILNGRGVTWFLVLSPWLVIQVIRATRFAYRKTT